MGSYSYSSDPEYPIPVLFPPNPNPSPARLRRKAKKKKKPAAVAASDGEADVGMSFEDAWPRKGKKEVMLEGYVEPLDGVDRGSDGGDGAVGRTKSLTDEDLEELKGCLDLGFGFSYEEIPELCNTLPALELCYSMSQRFLDEQRAAPEAAAGEDVVAAPSPPIANWKISSPGDHPDDVKARLKYWAQAVACTVRLCS